MFHSIPGYSNYAIDDSGNVLCNGVVATGYVSDQGYRMIRVVDDTGTSQIVGIHRLMALAFYPVCLLPNSDTGLIPNHIDGDKLNNVPTNIEWTTYSGNIQHAYDTGLRSDNRQVACMNAETRELSSFNSLAECGRFFGVEAGAIHWQLNDVKEFRPYKGHFIKYADDPKPWPEPDAIFSKKAIDGTKIQVTFIATGGTAYFASMEALGRHIGCSASSVLHQLRKPEATPYRGCLIRYAK